MRGRPEIAFEHRTGRRKLSIVLIDWGVRESFHSLDYLNRQTAPRSDYELIWLEFYGRKSGQVRKHTAVGPAARPALDKWLVLGYPENLVYHKHRLYNAGLLAADGDVCVICDSDAMFEPTFVERVIRAFDETAYAVVHLDQIRNDRRDFYPFNYPTFEQVKGVGCINWWENRTTRGLYTEYDRLHRANYGACMAARRGDLLAIGGADEHPDYLGFVCGPYELTFRLRNRGRRERWLTDEYLYHTWHPNQTMLNADYQGPHDGRYLSLRALHARATGQTRPTLRNPHVRPDGWGGKRQLARLLRHVAEHPEPGWVAGAQPTEPPDFVYQADRDDRGFDVFVHKNRWFALPAGTGPLDPVKAESGGYPQLLRADAEEPLRYQIDLLRGGDRTPRPPGKWERLCRDLFCEPLHSLPRRLLRKARKALTRV